MLISVLLSAQCTDINVNNVTKKYIQSTINLNTLLNLGEKIEKLIKKIGIFRIKAKSIYNLSKILIENHNGKVPKTYEELKLPGVIMTPALLCLAFCNRIQLIHIYKLAQRWGLTNGKNVIQTEKDLKRLFPKILNKLHLQIIYYGREYCQARKC